ncbi:MAG: SDR family NAD(P)-dependent oxidoreductase [Pseudomonadota bacterium]
MHTFLKVLNFYGRLLPSFTKIGYFGRGLFLRRYPKDFSGQRWLVTGASGGIGRTLVIEAAKAGADVVAVARSESKLKALLDDLPVSARSHVSYEVADMTLQSDSQNLLDRLAGGQTFDLLLNNVGVLLPELAVTAEGRDASFVTNLLSHYLLTEGLLRNDKLLSGGAIINMTSGGMYNVPLGTRLLNVTDVDKYSGTLAYAAHKRAQVALTAHWNSKFGDTGIQSYVMHPGWAKTQGVKSALPTFYKALNLLLRTPYQGGESALWLASKRPASSADPDAGVWLDRRLRPAHLYDYTKESQCSVAELVAFLDTELAKELDR